MAHEVRPRCRNRNAGLPLALFLLLTAFYLLTMSGHTYSSDEETMYVVTRQIALQGDVEMQVAPGEPVAALRRGIDNRLFSPYGILPSLLALPFFFLGTLAGSPDTAAFDYATRLAVMATNGPVTAATAALLAAWALRLGAQRSTAVALALLYGLCTFAWPYARTFFSEPLAALLLLATVERAHAARSSPYRAWPLLLSGVAAGLLVTTRIASGVVLPLIALYVVWPDARTALRLRTVLTNGIVAGFWWGVGLLPGLLLLVGYNLLRFGMVVATGYGSEKRLFTTPLLEGLYGLLLSPGKSVFLFAPPILLALPGALLLWRRYPGVVLLALGMFAVHIGLYARWIAWSGGAWGPRFLLPTVPLLILLAGAAFDRHLASRRVGVGRVAAGLLGSIGFLGALGGVLVNFDTYLNMPVTEQRRVYEPLGTPLLVHWQILADRIERYTLNDGHCALAAGFFAPEEATLLPRRTGASGEVVCRLPTAALLTLTLNDGRPPSVPGSNLIFYLDDHYIPADTASQSRTYTLLLSSGEQSLRLEAQTWNPRRTGFSNRDDDLGIVITAAQLRATDGEELPLIDRAIAPLPEHPRYRFAWHYERHNQHLLDHWAWYLPRMGLPAEVARNISITICTTAVGLLLVGGSVLLYGRRKDDVAQQRSSRGLERCGT